MRSRGHARWMLVEALLLVSAAVILVAGTNLSRYGEAIAEKTGLRASWIGLFLVAAVTSLPELITGISSILAVNEPDLAAGDVFGSAAFNILVLAGAMLVAGRAAVDARELPAQRVAAIYGLVMLALAAAGVVVGHALPPFLWMSLVSVALIVLYLVAVRHTFAQQAAVSDLEVVVRYPHLERQRVFALYGVNALAVVVAASALPFLAERIAIERNFEMSAVGTTLVATMTSLPEVVVTIAALRLGNAALAIGGLLGSNLFNLVILALDDMLYEGPLLAAVDSSHVLTALGVAGMTVLALYALERGRASRAVWRVAWAGCIVIYVGIIYLAQPFV